MKFSYLLLVSVILLIWGCSDQKNTTSYNVEASLPASFKFNQMGLKVITSAINAKAKTMSVCYGNDLAVNSARAGKQDHYPPGAVIALVTWQQQEDPKWFGGNIPGNIQTVEMIKIPVSADSPGADDYHKFSGKELKETPKAEISDQQRRISYISGLRAAVMP